VARRLRAARHTRVLLEADLSRSKKGAMKMKRARQLVLVSLLMGFSALSYSSWTFAQKPYVWAPTTSNPSGFPEKAPPGSDQHWWDRTRALCNGVVEKARANKPLTPHEFSESEICKHISVNLFDLQTPPPGSYLYPENPKPSSSSTPTQLPESRNPPQNEGLLTASPAGPVGVSFAGGTILTDPARRGVLRGPGL
jgi:hypothetical protein